MSLVELRNEKYKTFDYALAAGDDQHELTLDSKLLRFPKYSFAPRLRSEDRWGRTGES